MSDTAATAATAPPVADPAPPAPTEPEPTAAPSLSVGNIVSYTWEDTYTDSKQTRYGVVVTVNETAEGDAPTVDVAWLEGTATMSAELLDSVSGA